MYFGNLFHYSNRKNNIQDFIIYEHVYLNKL